jgi:hypothetical protein
LHLKFRLTLSVTYWRKNFIDNTNNSTTIVSQIARARCEEAEDRSQNGHNISSVNKLIPTNYITISPPSPRYFKYMSPFQTSQASSSLRRRTHPTPTSKRRTHDRRRDHHDA